MKDHRPKSGRRHSASRQSARHAPPELANVRHPRGNRAMVELLRKSNLHRDALLTLVQERLEHARAVQLREAALLVRGANWSHHREIADHQDLTARSGAPDRWHAVARAWAEATRAVCRGDLERGRQLIRDAEALHQTTTRATTRLADSDTDAGPPHAAHRDPPTRIRDLVSEIMEQSEGAVDMAVRPRIEDPWWTLEEDEEWSDEPGTGE